MTDAPVDTHAPVETGAPVEADAPVETVDLVIVGGGKAGKSLAMDRAAAGWSVVMVERDKIGGTCINVACIPTKSLVGSARTLLSAQHAAVMGVVVDGEPHVSLDLLRQHTTSVVGAMVAAHEQMFTDSGMDFVLGTARFVAERTVEIIAADGSRRVVRGDDVVINTGTTPARPPIAGLADAAAWTSESILRLDRFPESLVIVGGGPIGCEFASMFATFGTQVTLLQRGDQLLAREDPDVAAAVAGVLVAQGVDVRLGVGVDALARDAATGLVTVTLTDDDRTAARTGEGTGDHTDDHTGEGEGPSGGDRTGISEGARRELVAQEVLVATGRVPVTAELGLDAAGVATDVRGFVTVDAHLRTTAAHTWAAGDVAGSPQFTHASWNDFRILRTNLDGGDAVTTGRLVPYTVFTTTELARVGLTETDARASGRRVRVATLPIASIPRAKTLHATTGTWKIVVDADTEEILGAALLGPDTGEVVTAIQMAMLGGLTYRQVHDAVITHPTMGEGLNLILDLLDPPGR